MKVLILLAVVAAVYAVDVPTTVKPDVTVTPVPKELRTARYFLLRDGSVYDTLIDRVISVNAQIVSEKGTLGDRDVFIKTVPLKTYYYKTISPSIRYVLA